MALVIKDRVRQTSTTAGTGTITLSGSVTGYQDFTVIGTGNTTYYTIADQSGSNWEVGLGTYTAPNQLARTTVYESSNGNALVNFGSNIKDVFVTLPAEGFASPPAIGGTTPNTITGTTVSATTQMTLPAITVGNAGTGILEMVDGLDGYDYLNIYTYDAGGNVQVKFPNGIQVTGGINIGNDIYTGGYALYIGTGGVASGNIALRGYSNGLDITVQAPASPVSLYTLTLPTTAGSNNQVLKTDGSGNLSWLDFGSPPAIGGTTPAAGKFTSLTATGTTTLATSLTGLLKAASGVVSTATGGTDYVVPGGALGTPSSGTITNLTGTASININGTVGATTPNTGAFTTLTTTGAVTTTAISDPSAPSNGNVSVYAKSFGGYTTLAARNALNTSFGLQTALWSKSIQMWTNTSATAGSWLNSVGGSNGTFTAVQPTIGGTLYQTIRRSTYANVITTTNQILGVSNNYLCFFRGSTTGQGGFFFHARLGFDVWTNGGRFFAGLAAGTNIVTADPSTRNDVCGFAVDAADNGAISFLTRNTVSATKASTGYTITSNKGYDVYFYCSPNGTSIGWMIVDINAGTSASGSATLTLPTATVANTSVVLASNAALTAATAISIGIAKIYTETDY